ncbi:MAG: PTS sugar transporter subunit IIC [Chloroflexota bacterium]|nr:PTS sugar transporter subunit IIC [Chloroflexota bacterium]
MRTRAPSSGRTVLAASVGVTVLAAVVLVPPVLAQGGAGASAIGPIQAALIAIGYYLSNSPWILGNGGFLGLYRPLVAGLLVGVILGDPAGGAAIGAAINVLYLGFISAGGAIPADPSVAGWVGTALALAGGLDANSAISIGVAVGLLGTFIFFARMSVDAVFAHWADERADRADIGGVALMNVLPPQVFLFVISFVPVFVATYLGAPVVADAIAWLQANAPFALRGLQVAGGLLPAIGIAMNMRFIFRGSVVPYFFIGFLLAVGARDVLNIVAIGVIGVALGFLHVAFVGNRVGPGGGKRVVDERVEATRQVAATSEGV